MLKTCLNTFGKDFGHFEKKSFSIFLKFFQVSTLQGALGTFFSRKTSKQVQNLFGYFWKRVWVSWILGSFCISLKFFDFSTLQGALAKRFRENHIKTCLDNLGNVFGHFWKFEFFSISVELFWVSRVHWAESFSVEIIKQNMLKQCFWERSWRILKVSKFFPFFCVFCKFRPPRVHWAKIFAEKLHRSMLKTCLNTFGNVFRHFEKLNVFQFFEVFPILDLPGCTGQFFLRKLPQNKFETCLDTSKNVLDTFEKSNFFRFFFEFLQNSISRLHWARKFRKKLPQASLDTFGNVFRDLEILESFRFLWIFLSLQGSLGRAFFRRNNQAKHAQTMFLVTFLEKFESFAVFPLFCIFCEFRPPRVHWAKIFAEKITSKHVENMFDCFWERFFGHFEQLKVFPVFWSFSKFRRSRVHWARKNRKNYLEQVWTFFETFFGILKLWNFRFVWIFLESPGVTGHSVFRRKNQSKHSQAMFLGKFSDSFENFKVFLFF